MKTAGRLDMKFANQTYMKPLKAKFRSLRGNNKDSNQSLRNPDSNGDVMRLNLSAFNTDKRMHGMRDLVGQMNKKLNSKGT